MSELELKTGNIRSTMDNILFQIDFLCFETFDAIYPEMLDSIKKIYASRDELLKKYGLDQLLIYEKEFTEKTKLIGNKIDNILGVYSKEKNRLECEISNLSARKKLINYKR